jgi:hypothetical protein
MFEDTIKYLKCNWENIWLVIVGYTLFLLYLAISDIKIDYFPDLSTKRQIPIIESLSNRFMADTLTQKVHICENEKDPEKIEKYCNKLTKENCLVPECCYYAKKKDGSGHKCVHGTNPEVGPVFQGDLYTSWNYESFDKCKGNCPK